MGEEPGYVSREDAIANMAPGRKLVDDLVDVLHQAGRHEDIRRVHVLLKTFPAVLSELSQAKFLAAVAITMLAEERETIRPGQAAL